jgi:hypothetical protein
MLLKTLSLRPALAVAFLLLATGLLEAQSVSFNTSIIDPAPPDAQHLEKAIGYFTSPNYPSFYLGTDAGGYIYDTNTGSMINIDQDGFHYERARPFTYPGDTYAGIIASVNRQTIWYQNPANWDGGDPTQQWGKQSVVSTWCHDLRIEDIDGDGKEDVVCSGTNTQGDTQARVSFQNNYNDWQEVLFYQNAGDGITIFHTSDGRAHIVGCSGTSLNWYENPGGANARNFGAWAVHTIGDCTIGTSLATLNVGDHEIVLQASNESGTNNVEVWPTGFAYFDPGSNPYATPWNEVTIDNAYRDVHEVRCDTLNGVPFCTVGEQEQASNACNDGVDPATGLPWNDHPGISGCRAGVFVWNGGGFSGPTLFTDTQGNPVLGTQNQAMFQLNGTEYAAGANHHALGGFDQTYYLWAVQINSGAGASPARPRH